MGRMEFWAQDGAAGFPMVRSRSSPLVCFLSCTCLQNLVRVVWGETFLVLDREGEEPFINLTGLGIGNGMTVPETQYQYYTEVGL